MGAMFIKSFAVFWKAFIVRFLNAASAASVRVFRVLGFISVRRVARIFTIVTWNIRTCRWSFATFIKTFFLFSYFRPGWYRFWRLDLWVKFNPLNVNCTKWPNTQIIRRKKNDESFSVFDHFVGLALEG